MADEATAETQDASAEVETSEPTTKSAQNSSGDVPPEMKAALRKANKEAETLRLKLQEFEDRDKTEAQKLTDRAEAAEKRAIELETKALRLEVASEKGLTPAQAKRLVGSTREELEADAAELVETFKAPSDGHDEVVQSLDLGTRGTAATSQDNPAAEFASIIRRQLGT